MEKRKHSSKRSAKQLMGLDIYLNALSKEEYEKIKHTITPTNKVSSPLLSWEYFTQGYWQTVRKIKTSKDSEALKSLSLTHNWQDDPTTLLTSDYESLVITDMNSVIEWVNADFFEMTGYSTKYAIGKTPRFLQGENKSPTTRKRIRKHIKSNKPFKESIINYRKNGEEYTCELTVYPLRTNKGETSHFLALERETI